MEFVSRRFRSGKLGSFGVCGSVFGTISKKRGDAMPLYKQGKDVFVDLGRGTMLCIGDEKDLEGADEAKISGMIREAVVISKFRSITTSKGQTLH